MYHELISIVICTYNRADILKLTLPSYLTVDVPDHVQLEVIIVDNNSRDKTKKIVQDFIAKNNTCIHFKYTFEPVQGLSYARNHGCKTALGNYIAYLDDECIIPNEWLQVAIDVIHEQTPAFLGGPYYGRFLPGNTSDWYQESFGDSYILRYKLLKGSLQGHYLSGGNIIIRKDVFEKIGLFDTELGMSGDTLSYGEEQDLQRRMITQYPEEIIWYIPELFVWHCIRNEKISLKHSFKEALIRGQDSAKADKKNPMLILLSPIILIYFVLKSLFSGFYKLLISLFSDKHYYTLLYDDYINGTWRGIGAFWYTTKNMLKKM